MEPTELVMSAVRLVVSSAGSGAAGALGTRVGELISSRLRRSPEGRRALGELETAEASTDGGQPGEPAQAAVRSVLLTEVLEDPEFRRQLDEEVTRALARAQQGVAPMPTGQPGITIGGTRTTIKRSHLSLGPLTIHNTRTNQSLAAVILVIAVVAAVLLFRDGGEENGAAPLKDMAVVRTVIPDPGSVPVDWTVTEGAKAQQCGGQADCRKLLGAAMAEWQEAGVAVYAAESVGAASDLYAEARTGVLGTKSAKPMVMDGIGDESVGAQANDEIVVWVRSGTVLVKVAGKGKEAEVTKLARVVTARADEAQRGDTPTASMRS
ncbi:hypothetical protein [Streptomyces syringium]|uniref:hypothetical protein n=1 Tax=Streptomyces syringium TaxID=76729 RepID=UPI003417A1DF